MPPAFERLEHHEDIRRPILFMPCTNHDVTSDGRFLMVKKSPPTQVNVILNWAEELKRLAPTGKK